MCIKAINEPLGLDVTLIVGQHTFTIMGQLCFGPALAQKFRFDP